MNVTLAKPEIGNACNGCGLCCMRKICSAGSFTLGLVERYGDRVDGPCPALVARDDGGYDCGLVLRPKDHAPAGRGGAHDLRKAISLLIGAGVGCDEAGDDDSPELANRMAGILQRFVETLPRGRIEAALETWFGKLP